MCCICIQAAGPCRLNCCFLTSLISACRLRQVKKIVKQEALRKPQRLFYLLAYFTKSI